MIKFTSTGYGKYGFDAYDDGKCTLYLFQLWTNNRRQDPRMVYKFGITTAKDPYDRLRYNAIADRVTISQVYNYGLLLASHVFPSKAKASAAEDYITRLVSPKDFVIESKISGITEMRRWNELEVEQVTAFINNPMRYLKPTPTPSHNPTKLKGGPGLR